MKAHDLWIVVVQLSHLDGDIPMTCPAEAECDYWEAQLQDHLTAALPRWKSSREGVQRLDAELQAMESGVKAWNGLRVAYGKTMGKWMGKKYNKKPITFEICPITFPSIYEFYHLLQCTKVRQDLALDDRGTSGCSVHRQFIFR